MLNLMIARSTESLHAKAEELQINNLISVSDFRKSLLSDFECDGSNTSGLRRGRHILNKLRETNPDVAVYDIDTAPILTHPIISDLPTKMVYQSDNYWVEVDKGHWVTLRSKDGEITNQALVSTNNRIIKSLGVNVCERINSYFEQDARGDARVEAAYRHTPASMTSFETLSEWIIAHPIPYLFHKTKDTDVFIDIDGDLGIGLETEENNNMSLRLIFRNGVIDVVAYNSGDLDIDKENLTVSDARDEVIALFGDQQQ